MKIEFLGFWKRTWSRLPFSGSPPSTLTYTETFWNPAGEGCMVVAVVDDRGSEWLKLEFPDRGTSTLTIPLSEPIAELDPALVSLFWELRRAMRGEIQEIFYTPFRIKGELFSAVVTPGPEEGVVHFRVSSRGVLRAAGDIVLAGVSGEMHASAVSIHLPESHIRITLTLKEAID